MPSDWPPTSGRDFMADVRCARCQDDPKWEHGAPALMQMKYTRMLPTMPPVLKLARVSKGRDRVQPDASARWYPDMLNPGKGNRVKFEEVDVPPAASARVELACPRCRSQRPIEIGTVVGRALTLAETAPGTGLAQVDVFV